MSNCLPSYLLIQWRSFRAEQHWKGIFFFSKQDCFWKTSRSSEAAALFSIGKSFMYCLQPLINESVDLGEKTLLIAAAFAPCQVILVSANKLTRYIEPCQLTDDFGGSLEYDHSDWLSKRLVGEIEAANVSKITVLFQNKSIMSQIVICGCFCWIVWTACAVKSPKFLSNLVLD